MFSALKGLLQFFYNDVLIGVDADIAGDVQRFLDDFAGVQVGVPQQRECRGLGERSARADGHQVIRRLNHIAVARDDK